MARKKKYFILVMAFLLGQIVSMFPVYAAQTAIFDSEFQKAGIVYEVTAFIGIQKQAKIKVPRNKKAVYVNGIMEI